jgi:PKHD-type hydroxylase
MNTPAPQSVPKYWIWEGVVPKDVCEKIIADHFTEEKAVEGEYADGTDYSTGNKRNTKICWAPVETYVGVKLFNHILIANKSAGWNYDLLNTEQIQIGRYGEGGHYDWHVDWTPFQKDGTGTQRKLSISLFLSNPADYEGGDFKFRDEPAVARTQGTILVFPSFLEHMVEPVTSGVRYSAVTWARGPDFR